MLRDLFSCHCPPDLAGLLLELRLSWVITSHQANALIIQWVGPDGRLQQRPRKIPAPMALTTAPGKIALSCPGQVIVFQDAARPEEESGPHFLPRLSYSTGPLLIHDLAWGEEGLWMVNTEFSCLALLDERYHFVPKWVPPFLSQPAPGDFCHLNGMALLDGRPVFATALGTGSTPQSWRETLPSGGVLMEAPGGKILAADLSLPHSPRVFDGALYFLESGKGLVKKMDLETGKIRVLAELPGFARGLDKEGDLLFVGLSRFREGHRLLFPDRTTPAARQVCGVAVLRESTGRLEGVISFKDTVEEVFEVRLHRAWPAPDLWSPYGKMADRLVSTPDRNYLLPEK